MISVFGREVRAHSGCLTRISEDSFWRVHSEARHRSRNVDRNLVIAFGTDSHQSALGSGRRVGASHEN